MRRFLLLISLLSGFVIVVPLVVVGCPEPVFPHSLRSANLILRSDRPIDDGSRDALAEVRHRLSAVEIDDPKLRHRLFLVQDQRIYSFFARLLGVPTTSQGVNAPLVHSIFLSRNNIDSFAARYGHGYRYSLLEGNLAHIATHEIVHSLIAHRLGHRAASRLPLWKREGYAEYAAATALSSTDRSTDLCSRLRRFRQVRNSEVGPIREQYLLGSLLVEYLTTTRQLRFDELMQSELDPTDVLGELESGTCAGSNPDIRNSVSAHGAQMAVTAMPD